MATWHLILLRWIDRGHFYLSFFLFFVLNYFYSLYQSVKYMINSNVCVLELVSWKKKKKLVLKIQKYSQSSFPSQCVSLKKKNTFSKIKFVCVYVCYCSTCFYIQLLCFSIYYQYSILSSFDQETGIIISRRKKRGGVGMVRKVRQ